MHFNPCYISKHYILPSPLPVSIKLLATWPHNTAAVTFAAYGFWYPIFVTLTDESADPVTIFPSFVK